MMVVTQVIPADTSAPTPRQLTATMTDHSRWLSEFGFKGENTFQEVWKECRQVSGFGVVSSEK